MKATEELEASRSLIAWLADMYWMTPTCQNIAAFKHLPPFAGILSCDEVRAMYRVIETLNDAEIKEIAVDYTELFCGMKPAAPFPYESIYRGKRRMLMQEPASEVKRVYEADGYLLDREGSNEPADHISHEFGYLSSLLSGALNALRTTETKAPEAARFIQKKDDFVSQHVQLWVPVFCNEVKQQANTEFFRLIAVMTEQAVTAIAKL
jgi:TorA maturation chaperone TorD